MSVGTRIALVVAVALAAACGAGRRQAGDDDAHTPLVFAAASLRTALDEVERVCRDTMNAGFRASYAGSSALARQIQTGAPADVFISADIGWMDALADDGLVQTATRVNLLGNRLVLIAPAGGTPVGPPLAIEPGFGLAAALGDGRLAVADPDVVPAGKYAKAALDSLGVWTAVRDRIAPAENVRAALLLVSRAEAPLGIVYETDAAADPGVVVLAAFPSHTHPPIVYPAALTREAGPAARRVLDCLQAPAARAIFERWGFGINPGPAQP
jgi:molybdate transport system substrate-binding protein